MYNPKYARIWASEHANLGFRTLLHQGQEQLSFRPTRYIVRNPQGSCIFHVMPVLGSLYKLHKFCQVRFGQRPPFYPRNLLSPELRHKFRRNLLSPIPHVSCSFCCPSFGFRIAHEHIHLTSSSQTNPLTRITVVSPEDFHSRNTGMCRPLCLTAFRMTASKLDTVQIGCIAVFAAPGKCSSGLLADLLLSNSFPAHSSFSFAETRLSSSSIEIANNVQIHSQCSVPGSWVRHAYGHTKIDRSRNRQRHRRAGT